MTETIACPNCKRKLQAPEQYVGQKVQCPECQHIFLAAPMSVSAPPLPSASRPATAESGQPRRYDEDDFDDFQESRQLRKRYDSHRGGLIMALGLIALVGGMSMCAPVVVGPVAWALGTWDLREIREGRMDPVGRSMTQTGQVCGIVATVLLILAIPFFCLVFGMDRF